MPGKKILVVEPSPIAWDFAREIFDLRDDQAFWARTGTTALEMIQEENFDLVLIEALLPNVSGYQVCAQIKSLEKGKHIPVLMMGGIMRSFTFAHEARVKYGADDILAKPFEAKDLERKLAFYLDGIILGEGGENIDAETGQRLAKQPAKVTDIKLSGSLSDVMIPRIICAFWILNEDGVLHFENGHIEKGIHFQQGKVVFVSGGGRHESLQRVLFANDVIDDKQFHQSMNMMIEKNKRQGEVLIEMGLLTSHQLFQMLQLQAEQKILNLLLWEEGKYWFEPSVNVLPKDMIALSLDLGKILRKCIETTTRMKEIDTLFAAKQVLAVYRVDEAEERFEKIHPSSQERKLWSNFDGKTTINNIIAHSELLPTVAYRLLCLLFFIDAVGFDLPGKDDEPSTMPDRPLLSLSDHPDDVAYRHHIDQKFQTVFSGDYLSSLPVSEDSDRAEVEHAYWEACKDLLKTNLFLKADSLTKKKANMIFDRFCEAYEILSNRDQLAIYRQTQAEMEGQYDVGPIKSEIDFQKGLEALHRGDYLEATDYFHNAIETHNMAAEYHAYLGFSLYLQDSDKSPMTQSLAIGRIRKALEISQDTTAAYIFLGHVFSDLGKTEKAEEMYNRAVQFENNNREALKALHNIYKKRRDEWANSRNSRLIRPELAEYQQKILAFYQHITGMNHYELLGVERDVQPDDLRRAYFSLSKQLHPVDLYEQAEAIIKEHADEIFSRLTVAYTTLAGEKERLDYEISTDEAAHLNGNVVDKTEEDREMAQSLFLQGQQRIELEEHRQAFDCFFKSNKVHPKNAGNLAWLGYSLFLSSESSTMKDERSRNSAKQYLRQSLTIDPSCVDALIFLGRIYMHEGKFITAEEQFEKALFADPENIEALKGFREAFSKYADTVAIIGREGKEKAAISRKRHALEVEQELLAGKDYFERLRVDKNATEEDIRDAYMSMIERYNDEATMQESNPVVQRVINELIDDATKAYQILSNEKTRFGYLLAQGKNVDDAVGTPADVRFEEHDEEEELTDKETSAERNFWSSFKDKRKKKKDT